MPSMIRREQIEELLKMPVDERPLRELAAASSQSPAGDKTETSLVNGGQTPHRPQSGCFLDGGTLFGWPREHGSSR